MEEIFQAAAEELQNEPFKLNELTDRVLKEIAKEHHPHNRLLSAKSIQMFLMHVTPQQAISINSEANKYMLASNCLRNTLAVNFTQFNDNKMFAAIILNYSQSLNTIVQKQRQIFLSGEGITMKFAARGYILNEIMLKLVQKSHVFIPEVLRFATISLQIGLNYLAQLNEQSTSKQLRIVSKLGQNSKIPKILYSLGYKKVWKRSYLIILVKCIYEQVKCFLCTGGYKKNALQLQIYKKITQKYEKFTIQLSITEQDFIKPAEQIQIDGKQNEQTYLQEPIAVRQLTPRFYDEEQSMILSKLRRKKQKLTKKIQTQLRKGVLVKQQEAHVIDEVRREKGLRLQKKEQLIIEKQTVEVKKHNRQVKKLKLIRKGKDSSKGGKGKGMGQMKGKGMGLAKGGKGKGRK